MTKHQVAQRLRWLAVEARETCMGSMYVRPLTMDDPREPVILDDLTGRQCHMDERRYLRSLIITMQHLADELDSTTE